MGLYDAIAELPLEVEGYELLPRELQVSPRFARRTTTVRLRGRGAEGLGEDVTYDAGDRRALQEAGPVHDLAGARTFDELSHRLDALELFPAPPALAASRHYRRWAFESAALDLALRQAGRSLAELLGRRPAPVRFVLSPGLGAPPSADAVSRRLAHDPAARFKLDATSAWTAGLTGELAATGAVETVDLKGQYVGTPVDQEADPALYARVLESFPRAWIEDPALTAETRPLLEDHWERVTWDAPLHTLADVAGLEREPRAINVKPSRFGTVRELLGVYEHCAARGIACYGGGQFELGVGRGQIQLLASLFHADAPNDVAPAAYHAGAPPPDAPRSPLPAPVDRPGFRWG